MPSVSVLRSLPLLARTARSRGLIQLPCGQAPMVFSAFWLNTLAYHTGLELLHYIYGIIVYMCYGHYFYGHFFHIFMNMFLSCDVSHLIYTSNFATMNCVDWYCILSILSTVLFSQKMLSRSMVHSLNSHLVSKDIQAESLGAISQLPLFYDIFKISWFRHENGLRLRNCVLLSTAG